MRAQGVIFDCTPAGVFILETSIGLASWNDALSRKIHDHGVTLTRFEPLKSPVVHEFWLAWDGVRVEARAVDSCVYFSGIPDVDALAVALRLEGCHFPLRISYVPTDALGPSVRHMLWDRHQDWVVDEGVALPMKVNEIFLVPSVFLCRAYPGSVATIDE
jgi:hypothetical protein